MASICKRHPVGSMNGPKQTKVTWHGISPTLHCRDSHYVAYAEFCGPDNILDTLWSDVQNCAVTAAGIATLTAIFTSPGTATVAFEAAFKACLTTKTTNRVDDIQVHLGVSDETGDWGAC